MERHERHRNRRVLARCPSPAEFPSRQAPAGRSHYRIASNAIADYYRGRRDETELPQSLAESPSTVDPGAERAACIHPLINQLPEAYRLPLVLSDIDGLPQQTVAGSE